MEAFMADGGFNPQVIRADGGLVANQFMCQFLSDMLEKPVDIPEVAETTALGAAYLAGLQAGVYNGLDDITANWHCARAYKPSMLPAHRERLYDGWKKSIGTIA
jgi:glycerol kinase